MAIRHLWNVILVAHLPEMGSMATLLLGITVAFLLENLLESATPASVLQRC